LNHFFDFQPLPELMQGAGVALLTLLVPFAIGIITEHLKDRESNGNILDLHIALDHIWQFKVTFIYLLITVISPLLMSVDNIGMKSVIFLVWLSGMYGLSQILFRLYKWVKNDRNEYRKSYLTTLNGKKMESGLIAWASLWSSEQYVVDRFVEKDFFSIFATQIEDLLDARSSDQWKSAKHLLGSFVENLEKRNKTFLLVFPEFFPKILEWHYLVWQEQYSKFAKRSEKKSDVTTSVVEIDFLLDQIIKFLTKEALLGKSVGSFSYFDTLKDHFAKYKDAEIVGDKHRYLYLESLPIYEDLFENIPKSSESYTIWDSFFPSDWKVTASNLKASTASRVWLHRYIQWSQSRLWKDEEGWDKNLEEISSELLPEVEPMLWAKIYSFVFRPWTGSRVKNMIEKPLKFGLSGRVVSGWGDDFDVKAEQLYKEYEKNTYALAIQLFGNLYTEENLNTWIKEMKALVYSEESDEVRRRDYFVTIFSNLLTERRQHD
jgi:hypothetical protein